MIVSVFHVSPKFFYFFRYFYGTIRPLDFKNSLGLNGRFIIMRDFIPI